MNRRRFLGTVGVVADGDARAYLLAVLNWYEVVNERVGDLPVVAAVTDDPSLVAYSPRVAGEALSFSWADGSLAAGGSRWNPVSGRAMDGPYEGTTLRRANDRTQTFPFAWLDFYPDGDIYGR